MHISIVTSFMDDPQILSVPGSFLANCQHFRQHLPDGQTFSCYLGPVFRLVVHRSFDLRILRMEERLRRIQVQRNGPA